VKPGRRNSGGKSWARQVGDGHGLEWSAWSGHGQFVVRTRRLTGGPSGFDIFLKLSKPAQTWKLKMDALRCCKSSQNLHATRLGHYEQPSQLCRHPNLNRCRVKFLEQIHNLNFCGFLKGFNPFGKNLINSPKILLDMDFIKVNLVGITCMEEKGLPSKCQTVWFEKK
jgi:hypothetical protein